jgi:hypothetical protein
VATRATLHIHILDALLLQYKRKRSVYVIDGTSKRGKIAGKISLSGDQKRKKVLRTKQLKIDSGRRPTISRMEPLLSAKAAHFSVSSLPNLSPLEVGFC